MMPAPDPGFWTDVEAIFSEALALDAPAREALVAVRCGDRAELRTEVLALLEAHERATGFMHRATLSADEAVEAVPAGLREGDTVGAFRLLGRIAGGGMGTVYLAERATGDFTQRAAVKVIAAPLTRDSDARRFRTERQILASLRHPYIVALIDGGVTPHGEAFLVMELVDGVPITRYCRIRHSISAPGSSCSARSATRCTTRMRGSSSIAI
jgi:eukaryotic-like serine/threonine-protein kinase